MCGFLGAIDFDKSLGLIFPLLQKGLKAISHRGPDRSKETNFGNVYLGHNRLSIIDLSSAADQPFKSASSDVHIIYNGEIYNYKELRKDLKNTRFVTNSDTEVLVEGYIAEGESFFSKLRGIYTFAIFDNRTKQKILIGRDPSGIKPLYYFSKDNFHIFGSEIKALLPCVRDSLTINEDVLKSYLNLGYCLEPFTIYNEIFALSPGSIIEFNSEGSSKRVFSQYDFKTENRFSFTENLKRTEEKIRTAVRRNLIADVEVAVALSGGIDSSLIYAYSNTSNSNIKGLTIKHDDREYSETDIAKVYTDTLKGKHQLVDIESDLNIETLNRILLNFDQPYADSSAINVYYLTKATRSLTKVLIGGDGGDELFNGYPSMTWLTHIERFNGNGIVNKGGGAFLKFAQKLTGTSQTRTLKRITDLWNDRSHELLYDWHSWFPRKTVFENGSPFLFDTMKGVEFYESVFDSQAPAEFRKYVVFDYFRRQMLSDYLRKTDMMSMLNSVEYRVPLLDEDLTTFALTIPFSQKSTIRTPKKILRTIHGKIYPPETSRASKKGFTIPLDTALKKEDFNIIREDLLKKNNFAAGYIKSGYIEFLFKALEDRTGLAGEISRAGVYQRILMLYSLSLWHNNK